MKPYIYDAIAELYLNMKAKPVETSSLTEDTLSEEMLTEDRIDWVKQNTKSINTSHDTMAKFKNPDDVVDHIAKDADPTKKKVYTHWLVKRYNDGQFKQEDAYKVADHIAAFDKYKQKLGEKDINKYGSIDEIKNAVAPHIGTATTKKEEASQIKQNLDMPGHELKYDDANISIYHLHDKAVSKKLYARSNDKNPGVIPTEWCTATENDDHNMFDHYLHEEHPGSKLHVVHRKSDGAVFQYHPETQQFMDRDDNEISHADFKSIAPSLHKAWKENPDLL